MKFLKLENKSYGALFIWIGALLLMSSMIGAVSKSEIKNWYAALNRSPLTPPNYIFPVAWTILYIFMAISGWMIWKSSPFTHLNMIKNFYVIQMFLNWSWTPIFFNFHLTGLSLVVLIVLDGLIVGIVWLAYPKLKKVSILMMPYLVWLFFATYLNAYIVQHN